MNINDHEDRLLDVLLEEELGGVPPPDLTKQILAGAGRRQRVVRLSAAGLALAATVAVAATFWLLAAPRYPAPAVTGNYQLLSGQGVGRGATLRTTEGPATVRMGGYCQVDVAPQSTVRLEGSARSEAVYLERGQITCEVERSRGTFVVRTAVGNVEVTGTQFEAQVLEDAAFAGPPATRLRVRVTEGDVVVRGLWGEYALGSGQEKIVPEPTSAATTQGEAETMPDGLRGFRGWLTGTVLAADESGCTFRVRSVRPGDRSGAAAPDSAIGRDIRLLIIAFHGKDGRYHPSPEVQKAVAAILAKGGDATVEVFADSGNLLIQNARTPVAGQQLKGDGR